MSKALVTAIYPKALCKQWLVGAAFNNTKRLEWIVDTSDPFESLTEQLGEGTTAKAAWAHAAMTISQKASG